MVWWKFRKPGNETVTASWLAQQLVPLVTPVRMLQSIREWHPEIADESMPFLALASLGLIGFRLGANQKSIVTRIDGKVLEKIQFDLLDAVLAKYAASQNLRSLQDSLVTRLFDLGQKVTESFYAHVNDDPKAGLHPTWYAGKEVCTFLENGTDAPNPEEIMLYAQQMHEVTLATKRIFDDLLAANAILVE